MTLFHFANCVVLSYAPYVLAYKYSSLSDYTSVWRCGQATVIYLLTQFLKLLIVATFFPASGVPTGAELLNNSQDFNLISELIKNSVDVIDVVGLHIAINAIGTAGKGSIRFFTVGLGWAAGHAIATTFVPLAFEARTAGFQWTFIQASFGTNLDLVFYMCMASLIWTFQRGDVTPTTRNFVGVLIALCVFRNVVYHSWSLLGAETGFVAVIFVLTLFAYAQIGLGGVLHNQQNANSVAASYTVIAGGKHKTN